jgi:hypothetical protein
MFHEKVPRRKRLTMDEQKRTSIPCQTAFNAPKCLAADPRPYTQRLVAHFRQFCGTGLKVAPPPPFHTPLRIEKVLLNLRAFVIQE